MSFKKAQSGQPMRIKADTFNSILDATTAFKERQQSGGAGKTNSGSQDSNIILIQNNSGADANQFDTLGIDEPIILPAENLSEFENRVTFSCSKPSAGTHENKFVVLAEPIPAGETGRAYAAGVAVAWVYMEYDGQALTRADIRDGQTKLYPSANGAATVLWYEPKTPGVWGDTRAIVRFGGSGAAGLCARILSAEQNGGIYSQWQQVELTDDGGVAWSPVTNGLSGENDGTLYEINCVDGVPENAVVQIFPNPTKDADPDLPAWLFCYAEAGNTGFGKPIAGETDAPVTNPYIHLTVTDSTGTPILDDEENEQEIKVWRNATRTNLYTRFDSGTIFAYVRFPQPVGGVGGCIFSRTEPIQRYELYKPADGYSVSGVEDITPSTDITGNPADGDHLHVRGMMYVEAGSKAFRPWFVIDPDQIVANGGKVFTDEDDTTAGYLDDEIIVLPEEGYNWITKTVTPGGENDNKLLLEHNEWDSENTSVCPDVEREVDPLHGLVSIVDFGGNISSVPTGQLPPADTAWLIYQEYVDEYDEKNHSRLRAHGDPKYFIIDLSITNKVKVDFDDTTPGYLNEELIVDPGAGNSWLTKSITPGGENDNKLLLEHDTWDDSRINSTTKVVDIDSVGGGITLSSSVPPGNRAYIKFEGWNVSRDLAGHMKISGTTDYYAYWMELPEPTAEGDMIYASLGLNLQWSVLNRGESQSIMYMNGFKPEWFAKGNNESILTTQGGSLSWLDKAPDDSLFTTMGGSLTWHPKGDDESILLTRSGSFHWLPSGMDQSLMYVNGTQVDWFGNPSYDAVLINSTTGGGLAWFPKGDDESIYITRNGEFNWLSPGGDQALLHISGDALAWFDSSLIPAVLTSDASGLAWATAGGDESIFISRGGSFDWLDKGGIGSLLYISAADTLAWLGAGGEQSLMHIDGGVPAWLGRGGNQSLLYVSGTSLSWFAANGGNALLTTAGGNLSWKGSGGDQSIFISTGGGFDWLDKGGDGSLMSVNGGSLSWLGPGGDQALLHMNGTTPAWFEAGISQSMLIVGSTGDLAWKPKGTDESVYITRGGELDWMSKGEEGSIFAVINGELTWLPPPTGEGKFFLTFSDGALAWEEGKEWEC